MSRKIRQGSKNVQKFTSKKKRRTMCQNSNPWRKNRVSEVLLIKLCTILKEGNYSGRREQAMEIS
jgi:hypothetical protein